MSDLMTAAPVQVPPALECPSWCDQQHHTFEGRAIHVTGHSKIIAGIRGLPGELYVRVVQDDVYRVDEPGARWFRDLYPHIVVGNYLNAPGLRLCKTSDLRPLVKMRGLFLPGLFEAVEQAAELAEIAMPKAPRQ